MTAAGAMPRTPSPDRSHPMRGGIGHLHGGGSHRVTAVLVVHDGQPWLPRTLAALRMLDRRPDLVVAVDTGSTDQSRELLAGAGDCIDEVLELPRDTVFGAAVAAAERHASLDLADSSAEAVPTEWLWLLHDDCAPEADALAELLAEADRSSSAGILGPKIRGWHNPALLVECGLSITNSGRRFTGVDPGDRDQGQRDGLSDVMAVGSPGMLVRREVWQRLGGFDPLLPMYGDDIEFCMRAQRADERVVVVPSAVVHHREAAFHGLRPSQTASGPPPLEGRAAGLYTMLVHGPGWLLPFTSIALLLRTLVASVLLIPAAGPRRAWAELQVWLRVHMHPVQVVRARREVRRVAEVPRRDVSALRPGLLEQWGLAVERSVLDRQSKVAPGKRRAPRGVGAALLVAASLAIVAAFATSAVWSAGGQLMGGAMLPAVDGTTLWSAFRAPWHDVGLGSAEPFAPYVLTLIGLAAPPGVSVDFVAAALLLFTVPLAGASAYLALRGLPEASTRTGLAIAYALTPAVIVPSLDGRLGTAVVAILLPWLTRLLLRIFSAGAVSEILPDPTLRTVAGAALLLSVCAAFVPLVWVAVVALVGLAAAMRARSVRAWASAGAVLVAPVALLWPWSGAVIADPSRAMFEAGVTSPGLVAEQPPGWRLLLLDPGTLGATVGWASLPLLLLAGAALLWHRSRGAAAWGWWIAAIGLVGATAATTQQYAPLGATTVQFGFAGPMLLIAAVGLVIAGAGVAVAAGPVVRQRGRAASLLVLAALLAGPAYVSYLWVVDFNGPLQRTDEALVPAFVVDQALSPDRIRTLLLARSQDGAIAYSVVNGAGTRLGDADVAPPADTWRDMSTAVGQVAAGLGPQPLAVLADNAVRYLITDTGDEALAAALDGNSALRRVSTTDGRGLWEVAGVTSRARIPQGEEAESVPVLAAEGADAGELPLPVRSDEVPLVLAQVNDGGWSAWLDGQELTVTGDLATILDVPPGEAASVVVSRDQRARDLALLVPLATFLILLLLLLARRRPDVVPDPDRPGPYRGESGAGSQAAAPAGSHGDDAALDLTDTARGGPR